MAASYRLYQGPDHLLQVCSTGYSETYKRFYYRDVQALVLQPSMLRAALNWVFGGLTCCALLGWVIEAGNGFGSGGVGLVVGIVLTLCCLLPLALNLAAGPTCACYVRTAVQMERLAALQRTRTARDVIQHLKPLLASAQGTLAPSEVPGDSSDTVPPVAAPAVDAPPVADSSSPMAPGQQVPGSLTPPAEPEMPSTGG
jgi:hypothetical protein